ncbi:hypothetical protein LTR36_003198 [Oleoguttula mirabilis]|uniref:Restriction of telomere capping protein 4 n=1 Tax=Oleoguttula mirabilis TaxID=1507867 RepID=A0AAV9JWZ2_9PEZI|nr:hypothetical protein LTR36_003198 [Oleoguttula mirabilis]
MPLKRTSARLLSTVNGKPHATQHDHHDPLPTPPPSNSTRRSGSQTKQEADEAQMKQEEDEAYIAADPLSSDDEQSRAHASEFPSSKTSSSQDSTAGFRHIQVDGSGERKLGAAAFKLPAGISPTGTASKRNGASEHASSDSEAGVFSSQASSFSKRLKKAVPNNIHVPAAQHSKPKVGFKQTKYGLKAQRQRSRDEEKAGGFQNSKQMKEEADAQDTKPAFQMPKGVRDMFEFGKGYNDGGEVSLGAADADGFAELSPSLSSLSSPPSSPGVEETSALDLPDAGIYIPKIDCAICGTRVELFLKQDFEDKFNKGRQLNYKWQQRFCRYHKQHSARELWKERGYPEIDWDGFRARLRKRKHTIHLKRIISGEVESVYRRQLQDMLRKGGTKTALQTLNDEDGKKGGSVGYYGPRGEKLMTEHILADFADALRDYATKDKLVAAAGVSGGVSGFVQAVLVPELAVSLVTEDLGSKSSRSPVAIIAESGELGELLHPEQEDKVRVVAAIDDEMED